MNTYERQKRTVFYGHEPEPDPDIPIHENLNRYLNWYSLVCDTDDALKYVKAYVKYYTPDYFSKEAAKNVSSIRLSSIEEAGGFPLVYAWLARIHLNGGVLDDDCIARIDNCLHRLLKKKSAKAKSDKRKNKPSVQDYVKAQARELNIKIDEAYEEIRFGSGKVEFDARKYFHTIELKAPQARIIIKYWTPIKDELEEVLSGKDKDLKEAYSCFKKTEIKRWLKFVDEVLASARERVSVCARTRKPRKRKTVKAFKKIENLKYRESVNLKKFGVLNSIDPKKIIGASQLWVFNTKYSWVGVYHAADRAGLDVKGTTIKNYDKETSKSCKVGWCPEVVHDIVKGGKRKLQKALDKTNRKQSKITSRTGDDTILLRVVK